MNAPVRAPGTGPAPVDALGVPGLGAWYRTRTWHDVTWSAQDLVRGKEGRRVAVVLPALDEETTVGGVVRAFLPLTRRQGPGMPPLVDEVLVVDSGSTDATVAVARAAGARVVTREEALPGVPVRPGKGEVLWRALAATDADIVVYADSDLVDVHASLVVGLLGPILREEGVHLVKAFYARPLRLETTTEKSGGGRVTELLARPALATFAPQLGGVVQPLGGEYAGTRELLEQVPFAGGYGIEVGLLLDTLALLGLDAIAQVDVGVRKHRHRDLLSLGVAAQEIMLTIARRTAGTDLVRAVAHGGPGAAGGVDLVQFDQAADGRWRPGTTHVVVHDRPPMAEVLASLRAAARADGGQRRSA
ncbi:glucosyl-3-phosphoglycerate synthase [Aquipuribacter hungaricus]|uniref:Glucosyl-3-phosphoglycerate synthase n=1 Tax=Aquipuribacter hungaricus TaxID=545624 RepID=A0ABV7WAA9_9MICO